MAESNGNIAPIAGLSASIIAPIVLVVALFFGLQTNAGASASQPIIPNEPQYQQELTELKALSDPEALLASKAESIIALEASVVKLKAEVFANTPSNTQALAQLDTIQNDLTCIVTNAQSNKPKALECANKYSTDLTTLSSLLNPVEGNLVETARAIVEYANPGGHFQGVGTEKIHYLLKHDGYKFVNGYPTFLDCSAFMSFILSKVGVFPAFPAKQYSTIEFFAESGKAANSAKLSRVLYTGSIIPKQTIFDKIKDGTIRPGDMFLSGEIGGAPVQGHSHSHVVMYVGGDPKGDSVVSSSSPDHGGPHYITLNSIADDIVNVIRVNIPQVAGSAIHKPASSGFSVCIDPGHPSEVGTGAENTKLGVTELHSAWLIANNLKGKLESAGIGVTLTRKIENREVNNKARADICNDSGSNLMLRIHFDDNAEYHFTSYVPEEQGHLIKDNPSIVGPPLDVITNSKKYGKILTAAVTQAMQNKGPAGYSIDPNIEPDSKTKIGGDHQKAGLGGVLTGSFYAKIPTVLIEGANLGNNSDANWLKSGSGIEDISAALASGVKAIKEKG